MTVAMSNVYNFTLQPPVSASGSSEQAGRRRKRKKKVIDPEGYETVATATEADDEDGDDDNTNDSVVGRSINKRRRTVTNKVSTVGIPETLPGPVCDDVRSNRQAADKWTGNLLSTLVHIFTNCRATSKI